MPSIRRIARKEISLAEACCRCAEPMRRWDRIAGKAYCPNCEEDLIVGVAERLREPTERRHCAICDRAGTVRFLTFPLGGRTPVELDLCSAHLRSLLGRCLGPSAFRRLRRRLQAVGLDAEHVFLLHDTFYDAEGFALQPAIS